MKGALGKIEISIVVRGSERKNPKAKAGSHRRTDLKYMTLYIFSKGPWEPVLLLKKNKKKSPSGGLRLAKSSGGRIGVPDLEPRPGQLIGFLRGSSEGGPHGGEKGFTLYAGGVRGG